MRAAAAAIVVLVALLGASTSGATAGATFTVTTTANSGAGSLRDAIFQANATKAADTIQFAIGSGAQTITLAGPLDHLLYPVTIDGTTQPGYSGAPLITVDGTSMSFPCFQLDDGAGGTALGALV